MSWEVLQGDCRELMKSLPAGSFDAIITDPPFGINFAGQPTDYQRKNGMKPKSWDKEAPDVSPLLALAPIVVIWGGNYFDLPISRGWMAWYKPDAPPSMGSLELAWSNVDRTAHCITQTIAATNAERVGHPTQKPIRVMKWCMDIAGVPVGATVLDPFCGSGTTGVACVQTGRNFIGYEIDSDYCEIARRRISEAVPLWAPEPVKALKLPELFA